MFLKWLSVPVHCHSEIAQTGGLKQQNEFSHSCGGWKSRWYSPSEASLLGLQMVTLWSSLCAQTYLISLSLFKISLFEGHGSLRLTWTTSFNFITLKDPSFRCSHALSLWGLELQHASVLVLVGIIQPIVLRSPLMGSRGGGCHNKWYWCWPQRPCFRKNLNEACVVLSSLTGPGHHSRHAESCVLTLVSPHLKT